MRTWRKLGKRASAPVICETPHCWCSNKAIAAAGGWLSIPVMSTRLVFWSCADWQSEFQSCSCCRDSCSVWGREGVWGCWEATIVAMGGGLVRACRFASRCCNILSTFLSFGLLCSKKCRFKPRPSECGRTRVCNQTKWLANLSKITASRTPWSHHRSDFFCCLLERLFRNCGRSSWWEAVNGSVVILLGEELLLRSDRCCLLWTMLFSELLAECRGLWFMVVYAVSSVETTHSSWSILLNNGRREHINDDLYSNLVTNKIILSRQLCLKFKLLT